MKPNNDKDKKPENEPSETFHYTGKDGIPTDEGLHDEMLENEDAIREDLIDKGVIKEVNLKRLLPGGDERKIYWLRLIHSASEYVYKTTGVVVDKRWDE